MYTKKEKGFVAFHIINLVLWSIAILSSGISGSASLPIMIVGGGMGSIALIHYIRKTSAK